MPHSATSQLNLKSYKNNIYVTSSGAGLIWGSRVQKINYSANICLIELFFSSHWEVVSSMNCFVTEGGGAAGGGGGGGDEAEQGNSHFLQ